MLLETIEFGLGESLLLSGADVRGMEIGGTDGGCLGREADLAFELIGELVHDGRFPHVILRSSIVVRVGAHEICS